MQAQPTTVAHRFFAAVMTLSCHSGTLQQRLADAYADHLLSTTADELPPDLRPVFKAIEVRMNAVEPEGDDDPFEAATRRLSDEEVTELIERILALYGRLAAMSAASQGR